MSNNDSEEINTTEQINTDQINIMFVKEIEKHPCIYNYNDDTYGKKELVDEVWKNIGGEFGWSVAACKEKWRNIKTVFLRHRKRPSSGIKRHRYYLSDHLEFLNPFVKPQQEQSETSISFPLEAQIVEIELNVPEETKVIPDESVITAQIMPKCEEAIKRPICNSNDKLKRAVAAVLFSSISYRNACKYYGVTMGTLHRYVKKCKRSESWKELSSKKNEDRLYQKHLANGKRRSSTPTKDSSLNRSWFLPEKKPKESLPAKNSENFASPENPRLLFLTSLIPEIDELSEAHFRIFKRKVLQLIDDITVDNKPQVSLKSSET